VEPSTAQSTSTTSPERISLFKVGAMWRLWHDQIGMTYSRLQRRTILSLPSSCKYGSRWDQKRKKTYCPTSHLMLPSSMLAARRMMSCDLIGDAKQPNRYSTEALWVNWHIMHNNRVLFLPNTRARAEQHLGESPAFRDAGQPAGYRLGSDPSS
jgi:hypothetical protein